MSRLFLHDCLYFVTVPTFEHEPIFNQVEERRILLDRLQNAFHRFGLRRAHFSVMSDHYHFVSPVTDGSVIPRVLQAINGGTSFDLHMKRDQSLWGEYHVYVPTTEEIFARVIGYVVGNPVKHGDVQTLDELTHWEFSSYSILVEDVGVQTAEAMVRASVAMEDEDFAIILNTRDGAEAPGKRARRG